jgi:hypothetical protein
MKYACLLLTILASSSSSSLTAAAVAKLDDAGAALPPLPKTARLALEEDWSSGQIDPAKWYLLRKKWDGGNNGVVPENVRIDRDVVGGVERNVLVCTAHGDQYDGPVTGQGGRKPRVGGVIVTKPFFASGRFEIVMKIGSVTPHAGGPADPRRPKGCIPAVWTYAYRWVAAPRGRRDEFTPDAPLYNPLMRTGNRGANAYWSEIDFPEFGKAGDFDKALYNTFLQNRHEPRTFDVAPMVDGRYHTLTTEWRTKLEPLGGVTDAQVREHAGLHWVADKSVPFERYLGNPLRRLAKDEYAVYTGDVATHWLDGRKVAENRRFVPAMAAQLNLGVWLPDWAGPAPWKTATASFATVKVWQYDDPGDVRDVLKSDITDSFDEHGRDLN